MAKGRTIKLIGWVLLFIGVLVIFTTNVLLLAKAVSNLSLFHILLNLIAGTSVVAGTVLRELGSY